MREIQTPAVLTFLIMPGFPMACLTSAIEPLRAANEISGVSAFQWLVVAEHEQPVCSSANVRFDPDCTLSDLKKCDAHYLLSSPTGRFDNATRSNAVLRRLARQGVVLGGFSGGVFPLARSGLLNGKKCSIHWVYEAAFKNRFPAVLATDRVIAFDGKFETASGSAAVFDLMLHHIEHKLGPEIMTEVACWFQHESIRGEGVAQRIPAGQADVTHDMLPPVVARAVKIFSEHIEEPVTMAELAVSLNLSLRQLDRLFAKTTGQSPLKYYRMMRMEKASQLVLYSRDTIADIALAVGYSPGALVRHYRQQFGKSPAEHRAEANRFRTETNATLPQA